MSGWLFLGNKYKNIYFYDRKEGGIRISPSCNINWSSLVGFISGLGRSCL